MLPIKALLILALLPQAADGALTVVAEPDSRVVWDGVEIGRTDSRGRLDIDGIPLGEYEIEVSKAGFRPARRRIDVSSGHRALSFGLVPIRPVPPPPEAALQTPVGTPAPPSEPISTPVVIETPPTRRQETRASQVTDGRRLDIPWTLILPPIGLLAGLLVWLIRTYGLRRAVPANGMASPDFHAPFPFTGEPPSQVGGSSISFLDDLRRREAMADRGVHVPPGEYGETAIDLDGDDVRSFEDPENS